MSGNSAFYIVTVAGGKCLDNTQSSNGVLDCIPKDSAGQKWVIETSDSDPNIVAFKSCADGKYLRNNEPNKINWGRIGMGDEKQWWTLEQGRTPGSCLIRSNVCTIGASYLNDFQGKYQDNNYVHMWQMVESLEFWLEWYFRDASGSSFGPQPERAVGAGSDDLEAREAALAQKAKDLERREAALKNKQSAPPQAIPTTEHRDKVYPPPRKLERKVVGFVYSTA